MNCVFFFFRFWGFRVLSGFLYQAFRGFGCLGVWFRVQLWACGLVRVQGLFVSPTCQTDA